MSIFHKSDKLNNFADNEIKTTIMIRFDSDYIEGAHPNILDALVHTNFDQTAGYGEDCFCSEARDIIRSHCKDNTLGVEFLVGGTQTNVTVIDTLLRCYQGVISADSGHINVHETGAPEATGHKIIALPSPDGRLNLEAIRQCYEQHWNDPAHEHTSQPGMVYLSFPAENGLIYTKRELTDISDYCHSHGLYLFVDGARMGYGLTAEGCDLTLADLARLCDAFYIGGTKVGALFGEAVVFSDEEMKRSFRYSIKQHGGMLAKGRLLGIQFAELLRDGSDCLYFEMGRHANIQAQRIKSSFRAKGIEMWNNSPTNMQFPILSKEQQRRLGEKFAFEQWGRYSDTQDIVRFCTSWATRDEAVTELCNEIEQL